jgi:hypothetical protein
MTNPQESAPRVEHGPIEVDPDHTHAHHHVLGHGVVCSPGLRRKVFTIWRDEQGRKMGSWRWEQVENP